MSEALDKPVENIHPDNLPDATKEDFANALVHVVEQSDTNDDVSHHLHSPFRDVVKMRWITKLIPGIEKLAAEYHIGNFVALRGKNEDFFESMPLYTR